MYSATSTASSGATLCLVTVNNPANDEDLVRRASTAVWPGKVLYSQANNDMCLLTMDQGVDKISPCNDCTITATVSEKTTLKLDGKFLKSIVHRELDNICGQVGVQCTYQGQVITIEGCWDLVQKVRQKLHGMILDAGQEQAPRSFNQPGLSPEYGGSATSQYGVNTSSQYHSSTLHHGYSTSAQYRDSTSSQYGGSAASQFGGNTSSQYGSSAASQYGSSAASQYGGGTSSQYGSSAVSQYGDNTYSPRGGQDLVPGLTIASGGMHSQYKSDIASHSHSEKRYTSGSTTPSTHTNIFGSSHYDMIPNLSLDIVQLMKYKRVGFCPGIDFNEKDSAKVTVHFSFSTARELDIAMANFEREYKNLEQAHVASRNIPIPHGIHQEELGMVMSEIESAHKDTMINWKPKDLELKVVSAHNLTEIEEQLRQRLEQLQLPVTSSSTKRQRNPGALVKNFFRSCKDMNQYVEYQPEIILRFKKQRLITVRHGNLLDEPVGAIVNPCNGLLSHGGGLAKQIDEASGGVLGRKCNAYMVNCRSKRVPTGAVMTVEIGRVGHLKCKYVINAVGPNLHEIKDIEKCKELLKLAVHNILQEGERLCLSSIAIPAISSGLFGMDKNIVAEVIVDCLVTYQNHDHDNLADIRIVVWDKETYFPFLAYAYTIEQSLAPV